MKTEKSCGAVVEKDGKILVVYQNNGFWGFPKGHVEEGESEPMTAIREVYEETGVVCEIDEKKRFEFSYNIKEQKIHKVVVLFAARVLDDRGFKKQDSEISELRWVEKEIVEDLLTFEEWKDVWRKIEKVL